MQLRHIENNNKQSIKTKTTQPRLLQEAAASDTNTEPILDITVAVTVTTTDI